MEGQRQKQTVLNIWKQALAKLLNSYQHKRGEVDYFFLKLFCFFAVLNMLCYWLAMVTAYPWEISNEPVHYFLLQFPVGIFGAVFDSLSFFITIWIIREAIKATSNVRYLLHLSIDVIIAVAATGWILLVFSISGWLVSLLQFQPESLTERIGKYEFRVMDTIGAPMANMRMIYFGIVIGVSSMIPTLTHITLSIYAIIKRYRTD